MMLGSEKLTTKQVWGPGLPVKADHMHEALGMGAGAACHLHAVQISLMPGPLGGGMLRSQRKGFHLLNHVWPPILILERSGS